MTDPSTARFVWLDLETTGLEPARDEILSLGMILTDGTMRPLASFERDIHVPAGFTAMREMSDYVREMHTKSGLLQRCADSLCDLALAEFDAREWLDEHLGRPAEEIKDRPVMAGNSVHFDRGFLVQHMPRVLAALNYRLLDVSSFKVLALATVPGAKEWNDARPDAPHTPLADLEGSIAELAHWRAVLGGQAAQRDATLFRTARAIREALRQVADARNNPDTNRYLVAAEEVLRGAL